MQISDLRDEKIILSVLNWGWGHVSRSIGLIKRLNEQGNTLTFAGDESQLDVIKQYFPEMKTILHAGYPFSFQGKGKWANDLLSQRKPLLKRMYEEQLQLEKFIQEQQITYVISDHRYGFFSKKVPSIFVTHQVNLPLPWYAFWLQRFHHSLIKNFQHLWIMDEEGSKFAGKLSNPFAHPSISFIGIHSRFQSIELEPKASDCVYIISGPEPYAEQFFHECLELARNESGKKVIVSSRYYPISVELPSNTIVVSESSWTEMDRYLLGGQKWVSRSGYSTIMDAAVLKKQTKWIPTPGQAEQIYLNKIHSND